MSICMFHLSFGSPERSSGKVTFLGVSASSLSTAVSRQFDLPLGVYLLVDQVSPNGPAQIAGLEPNDILMRLDDQILVNSDQLKKLVRMKQEGNLVTMKILRMGKPLILTAYLAEIDRQFYMGNIRPPILWNDHLHSLDLDQLFSHADPSLREILKKHDLLKIPGRMPSVQHGGGGHDPDSPVHGIGDDIQTYSYSSQQKQISTTDTNGTLEYSQIDGRKHLRALERSGNVIFDGPVTTVEDRKQLPLELLSRLQELESRL